MKTRTLGTVCAIITLGAALACTPARAQAPTNPPTFTVTAYDSNAVAPGYVFVAVAVPVTNAGYYAMIVDNQGKPIWYKHLEDEAYDFKQLPNGYLHYAEFIYPHSWTGGGDAIHEVLDPQGNHKETITPGNGYVAESHEFKMLPNGHVLLHGYYRSQFDMSKVVSGGYPNALISGTAIQELDAQRNVVWQWRTWDHFTLNEYLPAINPSTYKQAVINAFHLNTLTLDDDGNLLISNYSVDVWKINRQTGEIMWRIGGPGNQFTFAGVDPKQAIGHFACHDISRLENGNVLLYCNGDRQGTRTSKIYEYHLDEVNKVATLVWQYTPSTPVYAWHRGSAQRLPNGNTFIGWGGVTGAQGAACTEVTPDGRVVFEMKFDDSYLESYRAYRFVYPPNTQANRVSVFEVATGNKYAFGDTGVALEILSGGGGYNTLIVSREPYAPVYPLFNGRAPRVLPVRVTISESALTELQAKVEFDAVNFKLANPTNLTVYYRAQAGQGLFLPQATSYNPATKNLEVSLTLTAQGGQFGEFIFGYPDVPAVALAPILNEVESYRGVQPYEVIAPLKAQAGVTYKVNQALPISLSWSPAGFAGWYQLQISTNENFSNLVVDVPYQTDAFYVWSQAAPNSTYYYRVKTSNDSGSGPWAAGSFETAAPSIRMTNPSPGSALVRGLSYFIQWQDNLNENLVIQLYKGSTLALSISTNAPSTGAFNWTPASGLAPGSDYSLRISSTTNAALFGPSELFSIIDAPVIDSRSVVRLADGRVQLGVSVPGADRVTVMGSVNLPVWEELGQVQLTNGSGTFIDSTATNSPARFYRLRVP